jgi:hypothetical protein
MCLRWKDYRDKGDQDKPRHKTMTLSVEEFIHRFLQHVLHVLHVLPGGFHRIRHFGILANNARKEKIALARELSNAAPAPAVMVAAEANAKVADIATELLRTNFICKYCQGQMILIEVIVRG